LHVTAAITLPKHPLEWEKILIKVYDVFSERRVEYKKSNAASVREFEQLTRNIVSDKKFLCRIWTTTHYVYGIYPCALRIKASQ
jgi:hypothetical protein